MMGDRRDHLNFQRIVSADFTFIIPAGNWHNLINTGRVPLKLYSIYALPQHSPETVHVTKVGWLWLLKNTITVINILNRIEEAILGIRIIPEGRFCLITLWSLFYNSPYSPSQLLLPIEKCPVTPMQHDEYGYIIIHISFPPIALLYFRLQAAPSEVLCLYNELVY